MGSISDSLLRLRATASSFDALPFNPEAWAKDTARFEFGNCYSYALGDSYLVMNMLGYWNPGCLSGLKDKMYSADDCIDYAISDGLVWTGERIQFDANSYPVALFCSFDNGDFNYHWARMDRNGRWSQKYISEKPTTLRYRDGSLVYDPRDVIIQTKSSELSFASFFKVSRALSMKKCDFLSRTDTADMTINRYKKNKLFYGDREVANSDYWEALQPKREMLKNIFSDKIVIPTA